MESNISKSRPDWITDEKIQKMRQRLKECPNPYTDEEMKEIDHDDPNFSLTRFGARTAKKILTEYGIPLTDEESTTENLRRFE